MARVRVMVAVMNATMIGPDTSPHLLKLARSDYEYAERSSTDDERVWHVTAFVMAGTMHHGTDYHHDDHHGEKNDVDDDRTWRIAAFNDYC
eukprot:1679936-Rhodomonas_salina.2